MTKRFSLSTCLFLLRLIYDDTSVENLIDASVSHTQVDYKIVINEAVDSRMILQRIQLFLSSIS